MQPALELSGKKIEAIGEQATDAAGEKHFCLFFGIDRVTQHRNVMRPRLRQNLVAQEVGVAMQGDRPQTMHSASQSPGGDSNSTPRLISGATSRATSRAASEKEDRSG